MRSRSYAPKNAWLRLLRHNSVIQYRYARKEHAFLPKDKNTYLYKKHYGIVSQGHHTIPEEKMQGDVVERYFTLCDHLIHRRTAVPLPLEGKADEVGALSTQTENPSGGAPDGLVFVYLFAHRFLPVHKLLSTLD